MGDNHKLLQMIAGFVFKKSSLLCRKHWLQQEQEWSLVPSCIYTIHKYLIRCSIIQRRLWTVRGEKRWFWHIPPGNFLGRVTEPPWCCWEYPTIKNVCLWGGSRVRRRERKKGKTGTSWWVGSLAGSLDVCQVLSQRSKKEIIFFLLMTWVISHSVSHFKGGAAAARETHCNWQPRLIFGVLKNQ